VAKKGWKKRTPEDRAVWLERQRFMEEVLQRALIRDGMTKEEARRYLRRAE
jgi:hypothetical protein